LDIVKKIWTPQKTLRPKLVTGLEITLNTGSRKLSWATYMPVLTLVQWFSIFLCSATHYEKHCFKARVIGGASHTRCRVDRAASTPPPFYNESHR